MDTEMQKKIVDVLKNDKKQVMKLPGEEGARVYLKDGFVENALI